MDKIKQLEKHIVAIIEGYISIRKKGNSEFHLLQDTEKRRYALFEMGFEGRVFFHIPIFHLAIQNEKIWIYEDKSEESMSETLLQKGVKEKEIVLAYFSPAYREVTDFAVA